MSSNEPKFINCGKHSIEVFDVNRKQIVVPSFNHSTSDHPNRVLIGEHYRKFTGVGSTIVPFQEPVAAETPVVAPVPTPVENISETPDTDPQSAPEEPAESTPSADISSDATASDSEDDAMTETAPIPEEIPEPVEDEKPTTTAQTPNKPKQAKKRR